MSRLARVDYPEDWPECPSCGDPALDGHITCGKWECNEGDHRRQRADAYAATRLKSTPLPTE